jgi:hypothetical protein
MFDHFSYSKYWFEYAKSKVIFQIITKYMINLKNTKMNGQMKLKISTTTII